MRKVRYRIIYRKAKTTCRFSKKIVVFCIGFIVAYTVAQIYLNYILGIELSPVLTTSVYAFFGTELAASALIKILDNEERKDSIDKNNPVG